MRGGRRTRVRCERSSTLASSVVERARAIGPRLSDVLSVGDTVDVKVIGIKDGKVSLSMKALEEVKEEPEEKVVIPKSESIGTNLGELFKNLKL